MCAPIIFFVDMQYASNFLRSSTTTKATITHYQKSQHSRDSFEPEFVEYRYTASDGEVYSGTEDYFYSEPGDTVEVKYLPSDPAVNHIAMKSPFRYAKRNFFKLYGVPSLIALYFGVLLTLNAFGKTIGTDFSEELRRTPTKMPFARFIVIVLCSVSAAFCIYIAGDSRSEFIIGIGRWLFCTVAIVVAFYAHRWSIGRFHWFLGAVGILAVIPVQLSQEIWCKIFLGLGILMAVAAASVHPDPSKSPESGFR